MVTRHLVQSEVNKVFEEETGNVIGLQVEMIFWNEDVDTIEVVHRTKDFNAPTMEESEESVEEEEIPFLE